MAAYSQNLHNCVLKALKINELTMEWRNVQHERLCTLFELFLRIPPIMSSEAPLKFEIKLLDVKKVEKKMRKKRGDIFGCNNEQI